MERRKITYRLYPSRSQAAALAALLRSHQQLYNAALEQRIDAYRRRGVSLSYQDQCKELTDLRRECPEFAQANCSSQQRTLRRLDIAFQAFFRRAAERGERAGFPRFKSLDAFPGFGFKSHGDGWRFTPGQNWKHGTLRLQGVGTVTARGQARQGGAIKSCELTHKNGQWWLSLTVECDVIERQGGTAACGLDWGVEHFASIALANGGSAEPIANPRRVRKAAKKLRAAQRALARKKRGGKNRQRARKVVGKLHRQLANQRKEFLHQTSAALVTAYALIATEELSVKNMTGSAKGTAEQPGRNVKAKAGLNREILDTAPGAFLGMLRYKAPEAGTLLIEVPTRKLKPSQRCPDCGRIEKKRLSQRVHACPCGHVEPRDNASARVALDYALTHLASTGQELARQAETSTDIGLPAAETPSTDAQRPWLE